MHVTYDFDLNQSAEGDFICDSDLNQFLNDFDSWLTLTTVNHLECLLGCYSFNSPL